MNSNSIAFIGLCDEYCRTLESADTLTRSEFVASMVKLLPRMYISAIDLRTVPLEEYEAYIQPSLEEDYYESIRRSIESLMGEEDIYLEVFEEDMKYSDTPIGASVSEGLADIFQPVYNFLAMIRDTTDEVMETALAAMREEFCNYWSQTLCNVMRTLNHQFMHSDNQDSDDL